MSITDRRSLLMPKRKPRVRIPWLIMADLSGLLAALWLLSTGVPDGNPLTVVLLTTSSVVVWFVATQLRAGPTGIAERGYRLLAVPVIAAGFSLALSVMVDGFYSGWSLTLFVAIWTSWMLVARLLLRRFSPKPQVLCANSGETLSALYGLPGLAISHNSLPPERFEGWDLVVVDPQVDYDNDWKQWILHAHMAGVRVLPAPVAIESLTGRLDVSHLEGRWANALCNGRNANAFWKRTFDVVFVVLLSPLLLLMSLFVALLVLIDGGRPVLFWQERVGMGGRPFRMVKFRTMRTDAERAGAAFATHRDPRVTRVGAFLRKFRLDELPQFWNVLKGDMSIIGPRPEQRKFVDEFEHEIPLYGLRHRVRPGITGWAQVMNGYAAGAEETREKLCYDLYYIKNFSLLLDVLVVLKTVRIILTGFGAR